MEGLLSTGPTLSSFKENTLLKKRYAYASTSKVARGSDFEQSFDLFPFYRNLHPFNPRTTCVFKKMFKLITINNMETLYLAVNHPQYIACGYSNPRSYWSIENGIVWTEQSTCTCYNVKSKRRTNSGFNLRLCSF